MSEPAQPGEGRSVQARTPLPPRPSRRARAGQATAEFAFIAPVAFVLIMSIVVVGIYVTNFIQVTNAAREGVRAASICEGELNDGFANPTLPDTSACTISNVANYVNNHVTGIPQISPTVSLCTPGGGCSPWTSFGSCPQDSYLQVTMSYDQPLYVPLVSALFESKPNGTRTVNAEAEAACQ